MSSSASGPTRSSACPAISRRVRALEGLGGLDDYLAARGEARVPEDPVDRAEAALGAFLASVYDEASEFAFDRSGSRAAYRELESVVYEGRTISTLVVPVHGLELDSAEVVLAEGFALARGDTLPEVPSEAVWEGSGDGLPNVLAVVAVEDPGIGAAVERLRRLQTALRLFETGAVAPRARRLGAHGRRTVARGPGRARGVAARRCPRRCWRTRRTSCAASATSCPSARRTEARSRGRSPASNWASSARTHSKP